jgi:hypothetical protein
MNIKPLAIVQGLVILFSLQAVFLQGQEDGVTKSYELRDVLAAAVADHQAVLAEIVRPMPKVHLAARTLQNERELLRSLRKQLPQYQITLQNGIIFVADRTLLKDHTNPLNIRIKLFVMPEDLNALKRMLPAAANSARTGGSGIGAVANGLAMPDELSPKLKPETLHDVTVREILIKAAQEIGTMISILTLPSAHLSEKDFGNVAFIDWELAGGKGLENYKKHLSGIPK